MRLGHTQLEEAVFGKTGFRRFTQDSPVLPDVWMAYGFAPTAPADLLLTPTWGAAPGKLSNVLAARLAAERAAPRWKKVGRSEGAHDPEIAYNVSAVAVRLYFDEMIRVVLPMTQWWDKYILVDGGKVLKQLVTSKAHRRKLGAALADSVRESDDARTGHRAWDLSRVAKHEVWGRSKPKLPEHLLWLVRVAGAIARAGGGADGEVVLEDAPALVEAFAQLMEGAAPVKADEGGLAWSVNLNRKASAMIWKSTTAIKADAARRLFEVNCEDIRWAVIDSGIDAAHPAFRLRLPNKKLAPEVFVKRDGPRANKTRVEKTYDFTLIRKILSRDPSTVEQLPARLRRRFRDRPEEHKSLMERLQAGHAVDWDMLAPFLEIRPEEYEKSKPAFEHGTHVAGILAADWRSGDPGNDKGIDVQGVCPDLRLYDLRVLDEHGESDEFSILAALQFVQYLNANSEHPLIHGVNLSLSIRHKVKNFACGCTPVCEETERLVKAGIVVVAAAGNDGYLDAETTGGAFSEGYRSISITDPGNAPGVITVGATHRDSPHTYGVSYFSSRGPTGDGRMKPDLVAPGEKITSTVPDGGLKSMDGTSMAAPHVSGAAALLIARHRELVGKPGRVKQILCDTATDLGRERYFQGSGMVDILRAMQSV
ncbi:MAG: S8 family peptidase [Acidobacteria bacterium]|nr:S8 family peptidase [Acidobacteriota bacterium]